MFEKVGRPAFAVVPIEIRERVRGCVEDAEDVAAFDSAMAADDGFKIPIAVVKAELESGKRAGSTATVRKLAAALGVPVAVLLGR